MEPDSGKDAYILELEGKIRKGKSSGKWFAIWCVFDLAWLFFNFITEFILGVLLAGIMLLFSLLLLINASRIVSELEREYRNSLQLKELARKLPPLPAARTCPNCGKEVPSSDFTFCPFCSANLDPPTSEKTTRWVNGKWQ